MEEELDKKQGDPGKNADEQKSKKNIIFGTVLGYVSLVLGVLSGLFFTPWIIEKIGNSGYGIYTLSNSVINFFLFDFGLSAATNTVLSKLKAEKHYDELDSVLGMIYKLYFFIDFLLGLGFIIIYFCSGYIYAGLSQEELDTFKSVFLLSAAFSLVSFPSTTFSGVLTAYEEFVSIKTIEILNKILYVSFTIIAILTNASVFSLVLANCSAGIICTLIKYLLIRFRLHVNANLKNHFSFQEAKPFLSFSVWAAVLSLCSRLVLNVMPSILGITSDSTNIAVFGIVSTIEGYVYTFGSVVGSFFLTKISRVMSNPKTASQDLFLLSCRVGKIQFVFIGLIEAGFLSLGIDFIMLWMHGDTTYLTAYWGISMIILYQLIHVPEVVLNSSMYITNNVKSLAIVACIKATINVILAFIFTKMWGCLGACISIAISRFIQLFLDNYCYKKYLNISILSFFKKTFLKATPCFLLSLATGVLCYLYLPIERLLIKFIVEVVVVTVVYVIGTTFLSFSKEERSRFWQSIGKHLTRKTVVANTSNRNSKK